MPANTRRLGLAAALVIIGLLLAGCSSSGSDLTGKTWKLVSITEKQPQYQGVVPADQQANYTILFNTDGTASIKADCNTVTAAWKTGSGAGLTITPGPSSLVACGPDSLGDRFVKDLSKTVSYGVSGSTLKLTQSDAGELQFTTP